LIAGVHKPVQVLAKSSSVHGSLAHHDVRHGTYFMIAADMSTVAIAATEVSHSECEHSHASDIRPKEVMP
jgi:hypothetical protein